MPVADTRHLITTLFSGDEGHAMADRLDRRVDALPGLSGLRLMERARGTYS
jgi:hypothetical protein